MIEMNKGSKGIVLYIWKKPEYGFMATQLAMSLKYHSPSIPIHLMTDHLAVSKLRQMEFFDTVQYIDTPIDPAQAKIDMYDKLPFDHNIFLDVDGLCLSPMDQVFDDLIQDDKPFSCFVHAYYNKHDIDELPLMVWAKRSDIWNRYGFIDEVLPACQSSFLYIRKGDFCRKVYSKMADNYRNKIPTEQLLNKWGGGQPDELYLNITLAQMGYDPACENIIYFANEETYKPHQLKDKFNILSLFGTAGNVKPVFEKFYDSETRNLANHFNILVSYKWQVIKSAKHANIKQVINKREAFKGGFIRSEKIENNPITKTGKTYLFTSFFDSGHAGRQRELSKCLNENLANPEIDQVFVSSDAELFAHSKLTVRYQDRPTYQTLIDWANEVVTDKDVTVIANSDIYFDATIRWPHGVNMGSTMIALSRWDVLPNGFKRLIAYEHSQDTWIFKGKITLTGIDYYMGKLGCDERIAFDANEQGYRVVNTAKDIITHHLHNTNIRSYTVEERIQGNYMPVYITSVRDLKSNKLLIIQPGKIGDILICLPIAKWYADRGYEVEWECPIQYHSLFAYVDYVKPLQARAGQYSKIVDISFGLNRQSSTNIQWEKARKEGKSFTELKYELAGVPYSEFRNLKYNRDEIRESNLYDSLGLTNDTDYCLYHSVSDYGSPIEVVSDKRMVLFEKQGDYTIFDWYKVILMASEIHCIDSSLANFVDAVKPEKPELNYYITDRVPIKADRIKLEAEWKVINVLNKELV